jgi:hypothetical protein
LSLLASSSSSSSAAAAAASASASSSSSSSSSSAASQWSFFDVQALIREAALREWDSLPEACALRLLMGRFVISVHPSICVFMHPANHPSNYLFIYLSINLFYPSIHLSIHISICLRSLYTRMRFI